MKVLAWPVAEVVQAAKHPPSNGEQNFAHLMGAKTLDEDPAALESTPSSRRGAPQTSKLSNAKGEAFAQRLMTSPHLMLTLGQGQTPSAIGAGPTVLPENLRAAAQTRTFRLDELGVFGISGAAATTAPAQLSPAPAGGNAPLLSGQLTAAAQSGQSALSSILGGSVRTVAGALMAITGELGVSGLAGDAPIGLETSDLDLSAMAEDPVMGLAEVIGGSEQVATSDVDQPTGPSAAPDRASVAELDRQRSTSPDRPLSVLVSETNGAIQVVAAAPGVNVAELGRLRRLVEDTAAQFGKRVQAVQLNGAPVEVASPTAIGVQT